MAFRMSTSTTNFEPTIFTMTPFISRLLRGRAPNYLEAKNLGQTRFLGKSN
jgi:hypothetical protein